MPLPDAKPSTRIYELLKNTDLENITFSQFQGVAEKIFAEQGAEDELRRIVLVNLARLSVVGEWTGLTSAGASGFTGMVAEFAGSGIDTFTLARQPIYGATHDADTTTNASQYNYPAAYPFIAPKSGTVSEMSLQVNTVDTTGASLRFAIYDTTSTNLPNALLGYGDFDMLSTGTTTQTSFSATISLTEGEVYYYVATTTQAGADGQIAAQGVSGLPMTMGIGTNPGDLGKITFRHTSAQHTLPDPFTVGSMGTTSYPRPNFGLNIT